MRNNFIAYILLACFGFSIAGFYPVFKVLRNELQKEIRHQMESGLKENELQVIEFRKQDKIDWVRQGKEFRISGQYYDVVLTKTEGDKVIYYCINDEKEKSLFAVLELLVNVNLNEGKSADGPASDFFSKIFTDNYCETNPPLNFFIASEKPVFIPYQFSLLQVYCSLESPPPDFL